VNDVNEVVHPLTERVLLNGVANHQHNARAHTSVMGSATDRQTDSVACGLQWSAKFINASPLDQLLSQPAIIGLLSTQVGRQKLLHITNIITENLSLSIGQFVQSMSKIDSDSNCLLLHSVW